MSDHIHEDDERDLQELFRAERQAESESAPAFSKLTRARRPGLRRLVLLGASTGTLVTAAALTAIWIANPPADLPSSAPRPVVPNGIPGKYVISPVLDDKEKSIASPETRPVVGSKPIAPPPPPPPPAVVAPAASEAELRQLASLGYITSAEQVEILSENSPTQAPAAQSRFSDEFIADLPVAGRSYQSVMTLAPGVQDADGEGSPNVHGSRARDFKAQVSGISNARLLTGQQMSPVNPNSIEEMEVITAGAGAEFSRAQGGFASKQQRANPRIGEEPFSAESYAPREDNDFLAVTENPLSTFSIDVDTASYSNMRRFLEAGQLPPRDAVRIEELVNYFRYDYPAPTTDAPFSASVEVADCPWNPEHRLARIGLAGREIARGAHPGSNLVFLIDVSGSMQEPQKLPLLKSALALLVDELGARDQVAMVVYAGSSGLALPPTSGAAKADIVRAIERLEAGGSTNGGAGLALAYRIARENFIPGGVNRVILATDGDFNVGETDRGTLLRMIEKDAKNGIFLTALGFGYGNLKDDTLEHLADRGNGNYAYIDRLGEARKVLVEEMTGTLVTIAKDVKIQVEFNPLQVGAYRLIGYENRMLKKEDFNDDRKDAGEIGAGHTVTALYELVPPGKALDTPAVDALKYQSVAAPTEAAESGDVFTLRVRYKEPEGQVSRLLSFPVVDDGLSLDAASPDFKFAAAVAQLGLLLRESSVAPGASFDSAEKLATDGIGADERGLRAEFLQLLRTARGLKSSAIEAGN
jgi:Ca-activated chloride channel family protein